jgi:hypothetical protein
MANRNAYSQLAALSEEVTKSAAAFNGLIASAPYAVSAAKWQSIQRRHELLRSWHQTSLQLLGASVAGEMPRSIAAAILDHLPEHVGWHHHRLLPLEKTGTPVFFRTDEAADGTVLEVQCPGSAWGVYEILFEYYTEMGNCEGSTRPLSECFTDVLSAYLGGKPVVHHLLDNSSHPAGERFFIQRARRGASYFGYEVETRAQDCNFVRAHDFLALLSENFLAERLRRLVDGHSVYDLPPIALFDQKMLIAFPFWDDTRDHFSDEVRALFPFTTVVTSDGLRLEGGEFISLEKFAALPQSRRAYFLKYAGSDVGRNWGSRSVFYLGKLSRGECEARMRSAVARYGAGERWILQRACPSTENICFIKRSGDVATTSAHSKHSTFYGPDGALAVLVMFEEFYKVHGSPNTIFTVGLPTAVAEAALDAHERTAGHLERQRSTCIERVIH